MQKRKLGNSNLEVSAIGLGCIKFNCSLWVWHNRPLNQIQICDQMTEINPEP